MHFGPCLAPVDIEIDLCVSCMISEWTYLNEQKSQSHCLMFYPCSVQEFTSREETVCGIFLLHLLLLFLAGFTVWGLSGCIYLAMNLNRRQDRRYTQPSWRNKRSRTTMLSAHTQPVLPVWTSNNPEYFYLLWTSGPLRLSGRRKKAEISLWGDVLGWKYGLKYAHNISYCSKNNQNIMFQQNMTSLNVLSCPTNSPKPPNCIFIIM